MNRRIWQIFTIISLLGAIALGIVAVAVWRNTPDISEVSDFGLINFYFHQTGTGTAYNESDKNDEEIPLQYAEYRSDDGRFSFFREISNNELFDYEFSKETEAEHRPLLRYVYVYYVDGEQHTIIQEQQLNDNQLREIIGSTNDVSALTYLLFAFFLLIVGAYCLYRSVHQSKKTKRIADNKKHDSAQRTRLP